MSSRYEARIDADVDDTTHGMLVRAVGTGVRVLELGAASGYMSQVLRDRGCTVTAVEYDPAAADELAGRADRTVIGDLNDPAVLAGIDGEFDVVLAGDVLEHLLDSESTLAAAVGKLSPSGRVVISVPNMTHVDLKLSLLQGRFNYTDTGLLDRTHIRFFTVDTLLQLLESAGLVLTSLQRMRIPPFGTELAPPRPTVSTAVLVAALGVPESDTYQFVVAAALDDGSTQTRSATTELIASLGQEALARAGELARAALAEGLADDPTADGATADLSRQLVDLRGQLEAMRTEVAVARRELLAAALAESKTDDIAQHLRHIEAYQYRIAGRWSPEDPDLPLDQIVEHVLAEAAAETQRYRQSRVRTSNRLGELDVRVRQLTRSLESESAALESERAAHEQTRTAHEQTRAAHEQTRAAHEQTRAAHEQTRAALNAERSSAERMAVELDLARALANRSVARRAMETLAPPGTRRRGAVSLVRRSLRRRG